MAGPFPDPFDANEAPISSNSPPPVDPSTVRPFRVDGSPNPNYVPPTAPKPVAPTSGMDPRIGEAMVRMYGMPGAKPDAPLPTPSPVTIAPGAYQAPNGVSPELKHGFRSALESRTGPDGKPLIKPLDEPQDRQAGAAGPQAPAPKVDPGIMRPSGGGGKPNTSGLDYVNTLNNYDANTQGAMGEAAEAGKVAGAAQSDLAGGIQKTNADLNDQLTALEAQRQQHIEQASQTYQQATKQVQDQMNAIKHVDPDRWWNKQDTAQKMVRGIAMAFGAFGATLSKTGQNYAQQYIQHAIDADNEAQKTDIESDWKKISHGTELAKDEWAKSQWIADQSDKSKLLAIEKAKNVIGGYAAQATSADAQAKLAQINAALTKDQGELGKGMTQRYFQFQQAQAAAAAGSAGGPNASDVKAYQDMSKEWDKLEAEGKLAPGARQGFNAWYNQSRMGRVVSGSGPAGSTDPLAGVDPKNREQATKELEKISQYNADKAAFDNQADKLGSESRNVLDHPIDRATGALGIQNTAGYQKSLNDEAYNATLRSFAHKVAGARSPEAMEHIIGGMTLNPGDNPQTRAQKLALATQFKQQEKPATPILDSRRGAPTPQAPGPSVVAGWK